MKKKVMTVLLICISLLFTACNSNTTKETDNSPKELVGTWALPNSGTMDLNEDGTGAFKDSTESEEIKWKTEGDTLKILSNDGTTGKFKYNLKNDTLELMEIYEKELEDTQTAKKEGDADSNQDIIGIWKTEGDFYDFELNEDGTGKIAKAEIEYWKAADGILEIKATSEFEDLNKEQHRSWLTIKCNYKIDNDTLIMSDVILEQYDDAHKEILERF